MGKLAARTTGGTRPNSGPRWILNRGEITLEFDLIHIRDKKSKKPLEFPMLLLAHEMLIDKSPGLERPHFTKVIIVGYDLHRLRTLLPGRWTPTAPVMRAGCWLLNCFIRAVPLHAVGLLFCRARCRLLPLPLPLPLVVLRVAHADQPLHNASFLQP